MVKPPPEPDGNVVAFRKKPPDPPPAAARSDTARVRGNVAALILALVLVFVGWLLVKKLNESSKIGDCLMAGRSNCAPLR